MSSPRQIAKGTQPPLQPLRSRIASFDCGFHNPTSRLRPCRNNMLCDGGFMSSVHLPTMSTKKRHTAASAGSISLLLATRAWSLYVGSTGTCALRPRTVTRPCAGSSHSISQAHIRSAFKWPFTGNLGTLSSNTYPRRTRQRGSGFVDIPWESGFWAEMTTCGQSGLHVPLGVSRAALTYQLDSTSRFWQPTCD